MKPRRSDRFDPRPVLVEPETNGHVAPPPAPMRTKLGDLFRLRARCGTCHGVNGQHAASCRRRTTPRLCRACQAPVAVSPNYARRYCDGCRAARCPECRRYGGQHQRRCRYERRARRPGLTVVVNLVAEQDILELYLAQRPQALRVARGIVGDEAEDIVQTVVTYLLERRPYLRRIPGPGYFQTATKHAALRSKLYAWARRVIAMDPDDLLAAEKAMLAGEPTSTLVRLPESPFTCPGCGSDLSRPGPRFCGECARR